MFFPRGWNFITKLTTEFCEQKMHRRKNIQEIRKLYIRWVLIYLLNIAKLEGIYTKRNYNILLVYKRRNNS